MLAEFLCGPMDSGRQVDMHIGIPNERMFKQSTRSSSFVAVGSRKATCKVIFFVFEDLIKEGLDVDIEWVLTDVNSIRVMVIRASRSRGTREAIRAGRARGTEV